METSFDDYFVIAMSLLGTFCTSGLRFFFCLIYFASAEVEKLFCYVIQVLNYLEKLAEPQVARGQAIDATNSHDAHYGPNRFPIMCSPCPTCFSKFNKAFYAIFARPCWNANTATKNFSECWMSANGFAMMCFDFKIYFLSRLRQFETFSFVFQLFH